MECLGARLCDSHRLGSFLPADACAHRYSYMHVVLAEVCGGPTGVLTGRDVSTLVCQSSLWPIGRGDPRGFPFTSYPCLSCGRVSPEGLGVLAGSLRGVCGSLCGPRRALGWLRPGRAASHIPWPQIGFFPVVLWCQAGPPAPLPISKQIFPALLSLTLLYLLHDHFCGN